MRLFSMSDDKIEYYTRLAVRMSLGEWHGRVPFHVVCNNVETLAGLGYRELRKSEQDKIRKYCRTHLSELPVTNI